LVELDGFNHFQKSFGLLYNFFSNRIDQLTYGIDEATFSVAQTFASKN